MINKKINIKKLAPAGEKKIKWAGQRMPVLSLIAQDFAKSKPFKNLKIGACLHVTTETANLITTLKTGGAKIYLAGSNPLSTQDEVVSALTLYHQIPVFAYHGEDEKFYSQALKKILSLKPDLIIDDGADLISLAVQTKNYRQIIGASEETTTGVVRIKNLEKNNELPFPTFAVNDARVKNLFDNRYGTGQSTIDGVIRATNTLLSGKNFVVLGYGWCLEKGTKIYTDNGIKNIEDIKIGDRAAGFNGYGSILSKFNKGFKNVTKIETTDGHNIAATEDHKILIFTQNGFEYKKIKDLLVRDNVVVSGNKNNWGKNDYNKIIRQHGFRFNSKDLFYILGCLIGDGTVRKLRSVSLACGKEDKNHFKNALEKLHFHIGECKSNIYLDIYNTKFRKLLFELGLDYLLSFQKVVPESIFFAKKDLVSSFLRGLFDTDGWVRKQRGKRIPVIGISSTSKKLVEQIQILLLNFGINSHIISRDGRAIDIKDGHYETRKGYELVIKGLKSRVFFSREVGFSLERKQREIIKFKNIKSLNKIDKYDNIPFVTEIIRKINKKYKITICREEAEKIFNIRGNKMVSKEKLKKILNYKKYFNINDNLLNDLKIIIDNNYILIPIRKIRGLKEKKEVYDIQVNDINSFIANGIIVHNCGKGLAQRAKGMGSSVFVCEVDPVKALEARMDGFKVLPATEAARIGDIFVTVTGNVDVLTAKHFLKMKDGAIFANSGHFNVEINIKDLDKLTKQKRLIRNNLEEYTLKNKKRIYLLAEGRLVNLAAAEGHPSEVMDLSFATQALSQEYLVKNATKLDKKVYFLPKKIEEKIAFLKLKSMGIKIDSLSPKQKNYMASWDLSS